MSSDQQAMEKLFAERGFGLRMGFGERPALIVIDFARAFTDPRQPLGGDFREELKATREIVEAARDAGAPIFYTTVAYSEADLADAGVWMLKMKGLASLRSGTPEVEIDPRTGYLPGESIIVKKYASAFFGTDLIARLNSRRVDTLIVTGCTTSGCVRATAVDGVQNGFRIAIAREAVGDRAPGPHEQSLFDLNAKYADVLSAPDILDYLASLSARHPALAGALRS